MIQYGYDGDLPSVADGHEDGEGMPMAGTRGSLATPRGPGDLGVGDAGLWERLGPAPSF